MGSWAENLQREGTTKQCVSGGALGPGIAFGHWSQNFDVQVPGDTDAAGLGHCT